MAGFSKTQLLPTLHLCLCMVCLMSSGTELSALVFGQHVHPLLILVNFSSGVVWRTKFITVTETEELKENIQREIANIPAEQFQRVNQNVFHWCEACLHVVGQHFQHHLWSVNCNYFITIATGQQAFWFIGNIRIFLAAGSALVTVNQSRKVRASLC
jgi:hypothetical protein